MKKKVLFVDNAVDFLRARAEALERAGYQVIEATSVEQAEQILQTEWVHAMLIDIRLRNDNDGKDTTGLTLAKREPYRAIPKIILTRYPSYEHVREVLGPVLEGLPPAVDFLAKQEGPQAMLDALDKTFRQHGQINEALAIHYEQQLSFFAMASCIEPDIDNSLLPARAEELADLFRRLFLDQDQVTLKRLITTGAGRIALAVHVFSAYDDEQERVVICGRPEQISREKQNHETFATAEGRTTIAAAAETLHFGALAYRLAGASLAQTMTLAEFYRFNPAERCSDALDNLFDQTLLAERYRAGQTLETEQSLDRLLLATLGLEAEDIGPAALKRHLAELQKKPLAPDLTRNSRMAAGQNLQPADAPAELETLFEARFWCGLTYGRLDGEGVLIDRTGQSWLIDFSRVQRAPLVRDFVALEGAIRFELLPSPDLAAREQLERRLLRAKRLDEPIPGDDLAPDVQKALRAIQTIRQQAARLGIALETYLGGLYLHAAARLAAYKPGMRYGRNVLVGFWHSLLVLAAIGEKVAPAPPEDLSPQARNGLWIDERNMVVWVLGQQLQLPPQEFALLQHLYRRRGHLCSRSDIIAQVFEADYKADVSVREQHRLEDDRLNTTVSRLRQSIEPDPGQPTYIQTVRGQGYRLAAE